MTETRQLLEKYVTNSSETAFRELVRRYIDLVHSTAFRLVNGDSHRAQDVAQTVFIDLAREASTLSKDTMLGGWLHRHTCFVAAKVMRGERRRQNRERQAAEMNALNDSDSSLAQLAPVLDEAINELDEDDRKAILLRFYERLDLRSVGEALGSSENAAQKRVSRALDQLQVLLTRRGIALSATALGAILAGEAVTAAPAGLVASITGTAAVGAPTILSVVAMSKAKLSIIAAIALAGMVTPLVIQHQAKLRLIEENQQLRRQTAQMDLLKSQVEQLSNDLAQAKTSRAEPENQAPDLLRLRGEVGLLRNEKKELEGRLSGLAAPPTPQPAAPPTKPSSSFTVPKEAWTFSGYSTPDAALQSAMWALREADVKTFLASLTPEARKRIEDKWSAQPDFQVMPELPGVTSYTIKKQENISDEEVNFLISMPEHKVETRLDDGRIGVQVHVTATDVVAKKLNNEWKLEW